MFETAVEQFWKQDRERRVDAGPRSAFIGDRSDELRRHFRENYPIMLDGAQLQTGDQGHFIRQARESLARGITDPEILPSAILRETLDSIHGAPQPVTKAGLVAIGPKNARVWWDGSILDNLDDVLSRLDCPRPLLRLYDVTGLDPESGRWNEIIDVDAAFDDKGRTVSLPKSDREYVAELGYGYADGRFLRLARTTVAHLPREGKGRNDEGLTARSNLRTLSRVADTTLMPDGRAREWIENRTDRQDRDVEAELLVHMLYRSFLREGQRALRRAPQLLRRDSEILKREYAQRARTQERRAAAVQRPAAPAFLVTRLDAPVQPLSPAVRYPIAPVSVMHSLDKKDRSREFAWFHSLSVAVARPDAPVREKRRPSDEAAKTGARPRIRKTKEADVAPAALEALVRSAPADMELPGSLLAKPVFAAAQILRENLAGMRPLPPPHPAPAAKGASGMKSSAGNGFGGFEPKRLAKTGVRFTRMALTLEGRMRPGARLKVAGKVVHADADGCFRLECVLAGRNACIPVSAGIPMRGEVNSQLCVEWESVPHHKAKI